jgi:hypothetical protein
MREVGATLPPPALQLYLILLSYADAQTGGCYPSYRRLAELMQTTRRNVMRYMLQLEAVSPALVTTDKRPGHSNKYWVHLPWLHPDKW